MSNLLKNKLIIRNYTDLEEYEVMSYIQEVILSGKISDNGRQFCYLTEFKDGYIVATDRYKNSNTHTFYIYEKEI